MLDALQLDDIHISHGATTTSEEGRALLRTTRGEPTEPTRETKSIVPTVENTFADQPELSLYLGFATVAMIFFILALVAG
ncbi:MAG: hypothetical protein AAGD38_02300 [Acidobacteriota bacterium]